MPDGCKQILGPFTECKIRVKQTRLKNMLVKRGQNLAETERRIIRTIFRQ